MWVPRERLPSSILLTLLFCLFVTKQPSAPTTTTSTKKLKNHTALFQYFWSFSLFLLFTFFPPLRWPTTLSKTNLSKKPKNFPTLVSPKKNMYSCRKNDKNNYHDKDTIDHTPNNNKKPNQTITFLFTMRWNKTDQKNVKNVIFCLCRQSNTIIRSPEW